MHTRKKTQTEVRSQKMKTGLTPDCQPGPTLSKTTSILTQKGVYVSILALNVKARFGVVGTSHSKLPPPPLLQ